jgi:hypothetical protein
MNENAGRVIDILKYLKQTGIWLRCRQVAAPAGTLSVAQLLAAGVHSAGQALVYTMFSRI